MEKFVCVADYEQHARKVLPSEAVAFYFSGADDEVTLRENVAAFQRLRMRPRILRNIGPRQLSTTLLGQKVDIPIGVSPVGLNGFAWPGGEVNVVKGAQTKGACYVLSTMANSSIEEVASSAPTGLNWYQLYIWKDRDLTERVVRTVERLGYKALVLTVDVPAVGHRRATLREPLTLPPHLSLPVVPSARRAGKRDKGIPASVGFETSICWEDIRWLRSFCSLPIILKGVMTAEDAILAVQAGVAAVWVSNHGGRQLDTSMASIDVLPEIVSAVQGNVEVYIDGGVRTGTDVLKALALGARAVFVGRPALWALACQGQQGVESVLDILTEELSTAMAIAGCTTLNDIKPALVTRYDKYLSSQL